MAGETLETVETTDALATETDAGAKNRPTQQPYRRVEVDQIDGIEDAEELRARLKRADAALRKANSEAAENRRRIEEIELKEEEKRTAALSETEKLRKNLTAAEQRAIQAEQRAKAAEEQLLNQKINTAVQMAAIGRMQYPDLAPSLVDRSRINYDPETDKVSGAKEALDRLFKDKPGLEFTGDGRGGSPPREFRRPLDAPGRSGAGGGKLLTPEQEIDQLGGYV